MYIYERKTQDNPKIRYFFYSIIFVYLRKQKTYYYGRH